MGEFETGHQHATRKVQIWRSEDIQSEIDVVVAPIFICLSFGSISRWHLEGFGACEANIAEAISLGKELNDAHPLATALPHAAMFCHLERLIPKVKSLVSKLIEVSTRESFGSWLKLGRIYRGWAGSIVVIQEMAFCGLKNHYESA